MALVKSKVRRIGYTPEAQRVDEITQALRSRSGI